MWLQQQARRASQHALANNYYHRFYVGGQRRFKVSSSREDDKSILLRWLQKSPDTPPSLSSRSATDLAAMYATLNVSFPRANVLEVALNRPNKVNAINMNMWQDLNDVFQAIEQDQSIACVVLSGGSTSLGFSSGMDVNVFGSMQALSTSESCEGRKRIMLATLIEKFQSVVSKPEQCRVPVLASIHGPCIGGAVDLITACDLRFCDASAEFSVKEIDLAIVADVGTLQRLPHLVGEQVAKEWAFTGRHFTGVEAEERGLVLQCLSDGKALRNKVLDVAEQIASKSPLTLRGIKKAIHYQRDHTTEDALFQVQQWNAAMLYSEDLAQAFHAIRSKKKPIFRKE